MKKILLVLGLLFSLNIYSQEYKYGVGARVGSSNGISLKAFVQALDDKYLAFEAIGGIRYGGYNFVGLFEFQKEIHIQKMRYAALYYYAGIGPHIGTYGLGSGYQNRDKEVYNKSVLNFGADAVLGLEYVFADLPISLGADFRPYYDVLNPGPHYFDAGITLRFVIK